MTIKKELTKEQIQYFSKTYFLNNTPYRMCIHKNLLIKLRGNKCQKCGISEWNGQPLTMQYHHIDGNHSNNTLENVVLLCPNCHSQTENYKGKNKEPEKNPLKIKQKIIELIPQCTSINDVIQKLNLNTSGNYKKIRQILKQNPDLKFRERQKIEKENKNTHVCLNCGKKLCRRCKTGLCFECYNKQREDVVIPSKQQLLEDINQLYNLTAIGRKYGKTDNAVRRWFKKYNIPYKMKWVRKDLLYDYQGQKLLLSEIAQRTGISKNTLARRMREMNLTLEEAINYVKNS